MLLLEIRVVIPRTMRLVEFPPQVRPCLLRHRMLDVPPHLSIVQNFLRDDRPYLEIDRRHYSPNIFRRRAPAFRLCFPLSCRPASSRIVFPPICPTGFSLGLTISS